MEKNVRPLISAVVFATLGIALGWYLGDQRQETLASSAIGARDLATAILCVNSLNTLDQGNVAKARVLLEHGMISSVSSAEPLLRDSGPLQLDIPNIVDGVERVRTYAVAKKMTDLQQQSERVLASLRRASPALGGN